MLPAAKVIRQPSAGIFASMVVPLGYSSCGRHRMLTLTARQQRAVRPDPRVRRGPHRRAKEPPLLSGEFLIISGEGQAYGEDDAEAWLRETGWHKAERRPLGGPSSVIIAEAI